MSVEYDHKRRCSELICDKCGVVIAEANGRQVESEVALPTKEYETVNGYPEHHCDRCRKRAGQLYDLCLGGILKDI